MLSAPLEASIVNAAVSKYWRVVVVELTGSTQSDLIALARAGTAAAGDVIVADYQSVGRGRLMRSFNAPQGTALLFSMYIQPKRILDDWGYIPLIVGTSLAQVLSDFGANLKWPNDLLINEKMQTYLNTFWFEYEKRISLQLIEIDLSSKDKEDPKTVEFVNSLFESACSNIQKSNH